MDEWMEWLEIDYRPKDIASSNPQAGTFLCRIHYAYATYATDIFIIRYSKPCTTWLVALQRINVLFVFHSQGVQVCIMISLGTGLKNHHQTPPTRINLKNWEFLLSRRHFYCHSIGRESQISSKKNYVSSSSSKSGVFFQDCGMKNSSLPNY